MGGQHVGFIVAAYSVALVVVLGMIAGVVLDYRAQRRELARLERRPDAGDAAS